MPVPTVQQGLQRAEWRVETEQCPGLLKLTGLTLEPQHEGERSVPSPECSQPESGVSTEHESGLLQRGVTATHRQYLLGTTGGNKPACLTPTSLK